MSQVHKPPPEGLWVLQRGRIYARDLHGAEPLPTVAAPGIAVDLSELSTDGVAAMAAATDRPQHLILERLDPRRRCFAAWHGAEIAAYCWISLQQEYVGEMESILDIQPGEAYIWDCATLPAYRRKGLYTALLAFMLGRLADEGLHRIWIGADLENQPSLRAFERAGFQPATAFTFFRLWRLFGFVTTALPGTPARLLQAGRRLFQIDRLWSLGPLAFGWR